MKFEFEVAVGDKAGETCRAQRALLEHGPIWDHVAMNPQSQTPSWKERFLVEESSVIFH